MRQKKRHLGAEGVNTSALPLTGTHTVYTVLGGEGAGQGGGVKRALMHNA